MLRVPFDHVNAIGDAIQLPLPFLEDAMQAPATLIGGYLPCIALRNQGTF